MLSPEKRELYNNNRRLKRKLNPEKFREQERNRDQIKRNEQRRIRRTQNLDKMQLLDRLNYIKNRNKKIESAHNYYRQNKEKVFNIKAIYRKKNIDKITKNHYDRLQIRSTATPIWLTMKQKNEIQEIYKTCRELTETTGISHCVDHIIPLKNEKVCGLHVPWNLQILTRKENCTKYNKL